MKKGRIVGIGGIFFKTNDVAGIKTWYNKMFNLKTDQWGAPFVSRPFNNPDKSSFLQWSPFPHNTDYFGESDQQYMINYRVENIEDLVENLKSQGVKICDDIVKYEYGKFIHIEDPAGIRIELWEPVDEVFESMYDIEKVNKE